MASASPNVTRIAALAILLLLLVAFYAFSGGDAGHRATPHVQHPAAGRRNDAAVAKVYPDSHTIYNLVTRRNDGTVLPLSELKGKVVLFVNVASHDPHARQQYAELQTLYDKYHDQGFTILAFPCNQFGHQEAGSDHEISVFVHKTFHITFPLMARTDVNGQHTETVFRLLKSYFPGVVQTNFAGKFLVGKHGKPVKRSKGPAVLMENDIIKALQAK